MVETVPGLCSCKPKAAATSWTIPFRGVIYEHSALWYLMIFKYKVLFYIYPSVHAMASLFRDRHESKPHSLVNTFEPVREKNILGFDQV